MLPDMASLTCRSLLWGPWPGARVPFFSKTGRVKQVWASSLCPTPASSLLPPLGVTQDTGGTWPWVVGGAEGLAGALGMGVQRAGRCPGGVGCQRGRQEPWGDRALAGTLEGGGQRGWQVPGKPICRMKRNPMQRARWGPGQGSRRQMDLGRGQVMGRG